MSPTANARKKGAQPGNTNAVKHGFYATNHSVTELDRLEKDEVDLTSEISNLRIFIDRMSAMLKDRETYSEDDRALIALIIQASATIGTLTTRLAFLYGKVKDVDDAIEAAVMRRAPMWEAA